MNLLIKSAHHVHTIIDVSSIVFAKGSASLRRVNNTRRCCRKPLNLIFNIWET